ncbi:MAG TPA: MFS transporter [Patescibacteria group bacterium]|nr:MFS transporter [Patescibacteria group bacterium]
MSPYIEINTPQYWKTNIALFLGSLVTFALLYFVQPLIPVFSQTFGVSPSVSSLTVSNAATGLALSMLCMSWLSDRQGRKRIMTLALLGSSLCTLLLVFADQFQVLLLLRGLTGVFLAGFPALAMTYINEEISPQHVGLVMGIYVSGTSVGGLVGRLVASTLADHVSWKAAAGVLGVAGVLIGLWFAVNLPRSKHFTAQRPSFRTAVASLALHLRNPQLWPLYLVSFLMMGSFVALFNYISYPLMAPPYNLSQTVVGMIFLVYLVGTFSSTFLGRMADRHGSGAVLGASLACMLLGAMLTLTEPLYGKGLGLALFTFGFFGGHSVASSWVARLAAGHKAQASALYLLFYYLGSSVLGAAGGKFLQWQGWHGVVLLVGIGLTAALGTVTALCVRSGQWRLGDTGK